MPEANIEQVAEIALEAAEEAGREHGAGRPGWIEWASLSTMFMALFSAAGGLLGGITGNEAIIERQEQLTELLQINRMDLDAEVMLTRIALIKLSGDEPDPSMLEEIETKNRLVAEYEQRASKDVAKSIISLRLHELFAIGTTVLSVAITMTGMAVVVRQKKVWYFGLAISVIGAGIVVYGVIGMA